MTRSTAMTVQGKPQVKWLKTAKGHVVLRPRGMKGFVWDYIVDLKLDVLPDMHFKPKKGLPRILTSSVFYDLRKPLGEAGYDVTSKEAAEARRRQIIQVQYIKEICDSLEIRRAEIGILAGEAGHLFYRGEHYAISLDDLGKLKELGVIILIIEKRGIGEMLRRLAAPYGIALLSTQGFLTENALDLAYLAKNAGAKVAILTDYDISGIVIAHQVPEVLRIGIDEETLEDLGILNKIRELEEYYIPNKNQVKTVEEDVDGDYADVDLGYLKETRIEIDAVMREVGQAQFWEWIVTKLTDELGEDLNYMRAIDMPQANEFVPNELDIFYDLVVKKISDVLEPEQETKEKELEHYDASTEGIIKNVSEYEDDIRDEFQDTVDDKANVEAIVKDLKKTHQETRCSFSSTVRMARNDLVPKVYHTGKSDIHITPKDRYDALNAKYHFELDP